jgi:hypothetical protein
VYVITAREAASPGLDAYRENDRFFLFPYCTPSSYHLFTYLLFHFVYMYMDDKLKVVNKRHHYNRLFHDLYAPTSLSRFTKMNKKKFENPDEHDRCVCLLNVVCFKFKLIRAGS